MSYLALYRKWRPKTFEDVVGQKQVSDTLQRAIREDKVAHAYLFAGPRGTGKTSLAKIFARAINCEQGPTDHPCNQCESCRQMLQGQSLDVIEIDAASNRGIDEVRSLREQINFLPVLGHKKIFIIDEAHMLTNEAWNALLKTIEEPPAHILFIFATTESEKLPVTILSRCQRYTFRRITTKDIMDHLLYVAKESGISIEPAAAQVIAVHADGGLRDALSILDQCSGMTSDVITPALVESMIGLVSKQWVLHMVETLRNGDGAGILQSVQEALQVGRDARQIVTALIEHLRALIVAKVMPQAEELLAYDTGREVLLHQAESFTMEEIGRYINVLQSVQNDVKQVDNPRVIVEMGLLSLLQLGGGTYQTLESRMTTMEQFVNRQEQTLLARMGEMALQVPLGNLDSQRAVAPVPATQLEGPSFEEEVIPLPSDEDEHGSVVPPVEVPVIPPTVTAAKPKAGIGRKSSSEKGRVPPKKTSLGPPIKRSDTSVSHRVDPRDLVVDGALGEGLISPHEYSTIMANVIKWLLGHNRIMLANAYRTGTLIYVDQSRAIIEYSTNIGVMLLSQERQIEDGKQAFMQVLRRPLLVEGILKGDSRIDMYRSVLSQGTKGQVVATEPTVTPIPEAIEEVVPDITAPPVAVEPVPSPAISVTPSAPKVDSHTGVGAGSAPTNVEGIIDDFLTVYDDPEAVLNPYYQASSKEGGASTPSGLTIEEIQRLPQWSQETATEDERNEPLLYDALQRMEKAGYTIYVEEVDDES